MNEETLCKGQQLREEIRFHKKFLEELKNEERNTSISHFIEIVRHFEKEKTDINWMWLQEVFPRDILGPFRTKVISYVESELEK